MRFVDTDEIACDNKDHTDNTSPAAMARVFDMPDRFAAPSGTVSMVLLTIRQLSRRPFKVVCASPTNKSSQQTSTTEVPVVYFLCGGRRKPIARFDVTTDDEQQVTKARRNVPGLRPPIVEQPIVNSDR
jgi:hypothetical protein